MANDNNAKLQVNFKLADGTLINAYAQTKEELEAQLNALTELAPVIGATAGAFGTSSAVSAVAQGLGGTVVSSSSSVIEEGHCKHGKLVYRTSKPGAAKEWKGWFCPSPQGTPDQCSPKFLR
jgi:hypothetical protein